MNIFFDEHLDLLTLLNKHDVGYLLVGGYAVIVHGHRRPTGDLDLWVRPTNINKIKLIAALSEAGFEEEGLDYLKALDFEEHLVFSLGAEPKKVDFITRVSNVQFEEAYQKKILGEVDGMTIPVIHLNDLVLSKSNTGREKDKLDVEALQKIMRASKK